MNFVFDRVEEGENSGFNQSKLKTFSDDYLSVVEQMKLENNVGN